MKERKTWFRLAISRKRRSASVSLRPGPSASGRFSRIDSGTVASMSASSEAKPTTAAIACTSASSGPMWRGRKESASSCDAGTFGVGIRSSVGAAGARDGAPRQLRMTHSPPKFHFTPRGPSGPPHAAAAGVSFRVMSPLSAVHPEAPAAHPAASAAPAELAVARDVPGSRRRQHGPGRGAPGAVALHRRVLAARVRVERADTLPRPSPAGARTLRRAAGRGARRAIRPTPHRRTRGAPSPGDHVLRHRADRRRSARCGNRTSASIVY